uniref:NADH dehydrogenase subunit 2 n=1 Tax=Euxiphydria potanini TaxID=1518041 RepID=UPI002263F7EF|nr:NADH dehydrogenase subunit 2 [Euxiphydria potanini]UYW35395.1 NADH dehydrogenase subunit 2 [Euxiphydria potanini]
MNLMFKFNNLIFMFMNFFFLINWINCIFIISTIISITSISWFSCWLGLEINLMSFIPLLMNEKKANPTPFNYYLIQAMSSSLFLFSIILNLMNYFNFLNYFVNLIMNFSLVLKLEMAPSYFWFPDMMNKIKWMNCMILSTWQKMSPMIWISYSMIIIWLYFSIILSSMIGSIYSINQMSLRALLSFSSINHMSWMMMCLMSSEILWVLYFIFYSMINIYIMYLFKNYNIYFYNQLLNFYFKNNFKFMIFFSFMSLGGMPPLLGFLMKYMTIKMMIFLKMYFILSILLINSLIILYTYLRMMFMNQFLYNNNNKMNLLNYMNMLNMKHLSTMNLMSLMSFLLIMYMYL